MSRGYWNYKNQDLCDNIFGWNSDVDNVPNVFEDKEISQLIREVFYLLYAFDSYKCSDWSEGTWLEVKNKFKEKWLGAPTDDRVKAIVEQVMNEAKAEIYKTFDIEE